MAQAELCVGAAEQVAIRRAAMALVRQVNRQGLWEAFQLRPGGSSIWTSAVVLHALAAAFRASPDLLAVPLLQRSWTRAWSCLDGFANDAVGFNVITPKDADSTIWLRRALQQRQLLNTLTSPGLFGWIESLDDYIDRHTSERGVCTYVREDGILYFVGLPPTSPSSWLLPHACVTLNRMALLTELGMCSAAEACDAVHSGSAPFWWQERQIAAWLIGGAVGFQACSVNVCRVLGGLFDAATPTESPATIVEVLLETQLSSGLWPAVFTLRVPEHSDRTGEASPYSDALDTEAALCRDNGIFTTSLVLAGLAVTLRCCRPLCA